ncbi:fused MFS/spermidine synthase [Singulisphaera sp. Ch08]|uniref:Fused MFS/spermidine synthase n=1 Tax=Singulisphaera sp. Ch08 TaxID=3120278 RepID=A0AAU7CAQ6_9BACT
MPLLFALTLFLSAVLLFSAQPMIAKMVLPLLGGAPAVWTTCMVFFQAALLAGYLYAHATTGWLGIRRQAGLHALLLLFPWFFLPIGIVEAAGVSLAGSTNTTGGLLTLLFMSVGVPFFAVATTAPLLQRWFAGTGHPTAADPYFLYGASNLGSLAALLAYPFVIEPNIPLAKQGELWAGGYVVLAALIVGCAAAAGRSASPRSHDAQRPVRPETGRWWRWVLLAFIPSSLMLGVTTYLSTDIAPVPLLWVIPLALYLLSFILVFARKPIGLHGGMVRALPLEVMALALILGFGLVQPWLIPLHLLAFFTAALVCHGELARDRPATQHLTAFYLAIAFGGFLGGSFNALVAPLVFNRVAEYPIALVLACLVVPGAGPDRRPTRGRKWDLAIPFLVFGLTTALIKNDRGWIGPLGTMLVSGLVTLVCWTHRTHPVRFGLTIGAVLLASGTTAGVNGRVLHQERNFFGVLQVTEDLQSRSHRLFHGRTLHGQQSLDPARRREPLSYYHRSGPIGQVFDAFHARPSEAGRNVAVVGLGVGSLAAYAEPGECWTFYEIDPAVFRIASDPRKFTFLRDSRAGSLQVILGDARLKLREAPDQRYAVIVLDAFSADAIPMHLLTREALAIYRRKLAGQGILAFHISNRSIELESVLEALARDAGLVCRIRSDRNLTPEETVTGKQESIWAVMAARDSDLDRVATDPKWAMPRPRDGSVWTDDFSSLAGHLIFKSAPRVTPQRGKTREQPTHSRSRRDPPTLSPSSAISRPTR